MTWHRHRWTAWEDYEQWLRHLPTGREFSALYQRRRCEVCGKRQERQP